MSSGRLHVISHVICTATGHLRRHVTGAAAVGRIAGYAGRPGHSVGCVADTEPEPVRRVQAGTVGLAYRTWDPPGRLCSAKTHP